MSNEVGSGIVPATVSGRRFRDEQGRLNARVAAVSDRVELVVAVMAVLKAGATFSVIGASLPPLARPAGSLTP